MKLQSLRLKNFRQFYDETPTLRFSPSAGRNVSVVHGSNGAGKTALLNAFTWALYETFTAAFQLPSQLVNKRAIRETQHGEHIEAWVEVAFEHGERRYLLCRTLEVLRTSSEPGWEAHGGSRATLQSCGSAGKWTVHDQVAASIARILPVDLHSYFFFDGERIEQIGQVNDKAEQKRLGEATKKLLGIEVLVRGRNHLDSVRKQLEGELANIGDPETKGFVQKKVALEKERTDVTGRLAELDRNAEAERARQKEIEQRLRTLEDARAAQERRDWLTRDREARKDSLKSTRSSVSGVVSTKGYTVFLPDQISVFRKLIEGLRERGELPAGIKRQFVDDLLAEAMCICSRSLPSDSEARTAVEAWRTRTGLGEVEEKAIQMGGAVRMLEQDVPETFDSIDQLQRRGAADREELARIETELDEINEALRNNPKEEVSRLEDMRDQLETVLQNIYREHGECGARVKEIDRQIGQCDQDIGQHRAKEEKQEVAKRRVSVSIQARDVIHEVRGLFEAEFREKLGQRISDLFAKISVTPYAPILADDWSLRLLESAGGRALPVAASQGESQILSLSFIGSIIELAREMLAKRSEITGPESAVYPIVMDSPFGSLDPTYRHQISEHIPALADQVVLMVTRTQWRGEVEQSLNRRVNHQYVLTYYTPRDDVDEDTIEIDGDSYDLVKRSPNDFEYTKITEVSHG